MPNNRFYLMLIVLQMALEGLPQATISFFRAVYPTLTETLYLNAQQLGELSYMRGSAASRHMSMLLEHGYVVRRHRSAWTLSDRLLKNPDLISLLRVSNGLI